jgi:EAL domain-containing protein (putative c-di-GMP-specific phosphodiesterase class I)
MYRAKTQGKARSAVFDSSMRADAEERLAVEQDLHRAVETPGELVVWFQPTISLVTGRIVLAEALVRWVHPERGLLLPTEFLPVAEETGLIGSIGWQVLDQTLREIRSWRDAGLGVVGSVNLSGNQLDEPGFAEHVGAALRRNALLPADLCLEVTERVLDDPSSPAASMVEALRRYGVAIAIDDFGRGQSSLAYLRDHPADIVKIDGVFVTALETNPRDAAIVGGMVQLAHALGMTCVAEGVEQEAQLSRLAELGCDQVQGYLLARPRPAAEFTAGLIESRGRQSTHRREPASGQRIM